MNWEQFYTIMNYISGPLVGAIIGYFTNYIAVKMLFHPYEPIRIFGFTLPFTPGIIPKRKSHLARAIGNAVGENLFTEKDIKDVICSDMLKERISSSLMEKLDAVSEKKPIELISHIASEEKTEAIKEKTALLVSNKILESAKEIDVGQLIAEKGRDVITEKKASMGFFGMFLSDELISSVLEQLKEKIGEFLDGEGKELISGHCKEKTDAIFHTPLNESLTIVGDIDRDILKKKIEETYEDLAAKALAAISKDLDISGTVERKVNEMSTKELEQLCLSVMKRELGAVINLGALIGFVIGIINIFI